MNKLKNYNVDLDLIQERIAKLKNDRLSFNGNIRRKLKSILYERDVIDYLCQRDEVSQIYYLNDYTEKYVKGELDDCIEHIENLLNMLGADAVMKVNNQCKNIDFKCFNYSRLSSANEYMIYNGNLNSEYGMDRLVVQVLGRNDSPGWATNHNKVTDILFLYVPETKFLYEINFKELVKYTKKYMREHHMEGNNILLDTCLKWWKDSSYEVCITLDMEELIKSKIIKNFVKLESNSDIIDTELKKA